MKLSNEGAENTDEKLTTSPGNDHAPDSSWFKGESIDYVRRQLFNGQAKIYQYLDRETVQRLVDEHLSGKTNRRLLIWSLLNVEQWFERFL